MRPPADDSDLAAGQFRSFPPGRRGVLVPESNRAAAAAGITMYTASKPLVLIAQNLAFELTRRLGARVLPGQRTTWQSGIDPTSWQGLLAGWRQTCGPVDAMAVYQRRQAGRTGLTALLVRGDRPVAVVKLRDQGADLLREQEALQRVTAAGTSTFRVPPPLGHGEVDGLTWSAQECVFSRPHRPVLDPPDELFAEVSQALGHDSSASGSRVGHGDLSPWNLRRDHRGTTWLFDWEDWGDLPCDADQAYYWATRQYLSPVEIPAGLDRAGLQWAADTVIERTREHPSEAENARVAVAAVQQALDATR